MPLDLKPNELLAETKVPDATPGVITMYSLSDEQSGDDIRICAEKHYRLVPPKELSAEDLAAYRRRGE